MVKKMKKFRITHIDQGVDPTIPLDITGVVFGDQHSGRWPKVSFSDGTTASYLWLTNTKVVFLTGRNRDVFTNDRYADAIREFYESDRDFNDSNWRTQKQRVPTWHPNNTRDQILA